MHQLFTWPIAGYCLTLLLWRHFCPTIVFYELVFDFLLLSTHQYFVYSQKLPALRIILTMKSCLLQIKPLVDPTKKIMNVHITTYQWHEFFPHGNELDLNFELFDIMPFCAWSWRGYFDLQQAATLVLLSLFGLQLSLYDSPPSFG